MLSESNLFTRKYSSLYLTLKNYYCSRKTNSGERSKLRTEERQKISQYITCSLASKEKGKNVYAVDTTNHYRTRALKGIDRKNVRAKNNKFSEPGYEYSVLCHLKEKGWAIPVNISRVSSEDNKYTLAAKQVLNAHSYGDKDSMTISIGDAAYSNVNYIEELSKEDNIINITRDRKNRAIYNIFAGEKKKSGRKRYYGDKLNLAQSQDMLIPNNIVKFGHSSNKGKEVEVVVSEYKNFLVKGRKHKSMKEKPVNYVKVEVYDLEGNKVYNNELWLCVSGKRRDEIKAEEIYNYYKSRFDIEHFFKFAKSKLRFDKLQTTNPEIDEDYCMFVMIAYNHLYHLKTHANISGKYDWYPRKVEECNLTPATIYRSLSTIKHHFQGIVNPAITRGIPDARNVRKKFFKRGNSPVIRKNDQREKVEITIKVPFGKSSKFTKTAFNVKTANLEQISDEMAKISNKIFNIFEINAMQLE